MSQLVILLNDFGLAELVQRRSRFRVKASEYFTLLIWACMRIPYNTLNIKDSYIMRYVYCID